MAGAASSYAEITKAVAGLIDHHVENDPTVAAYMIARAALVQINGLRGSQATAELGYRLSDEFATGSQN